MTGFQTNVSPEDLRGISLIQRIQGKKNNNLNVYDTDTSFGYENVKSTSTTNSTYDNERKTKHFRILASKQIQHKLQTTRMQNYET